MNYLLTIAACIASLGLHAQPIIGEWKSCELLEPHKITELTLYAAPQPPCPEARCSDATLTIHSEAAGNTVHYTVSQGPCPPTGPPFTLTARSVTGYAGTWKVEDGTTTISIVTNTASIDFVLIPVSKSELVLKRK